MNSTKYQKILAENLPKGWDLAVGGLSNKKPGYHKFEVQNHKARE